MLKGAVGVAASQPIIHVALMIDESTYVQQRKSEIPEICATKET